MIKKEFTSRVCATTFKDVTNISCYMDNHIATLNSKIKISELQNFNQANTNN